MAPSFNVVVKPNDWSKSGREVARAAAATTPTKQLQLKFWTEFVAHLDAIKFPTKPQAPRPQHWLQISLGRAGFILSTTVNLREGRIGVEVYINHERSKEYFRQLQARRDEIHQKLGFQLDWQELPDSHACRIAVFRPDSDLADENKWPTYFAWLSDNAANLSTVFRPLIRELP